MDTQTNTTVLANAKVRINDSHGRFVPNVSISGCKIEYYESDNTLNVSIPKVPEPADITELTKGSLLGARASLNNKNGKYSITFNYTGDRLSAVGKKIVKAELIAALDAIYSDIEA